MSDNANDGDLLIIGRRQDGSLMVIIAEAGSTMENQLLWLFGATGLLHPGFSVKAELESDQVRLEFASRYILEQLGVEVEDTATNYLERMLERFSGRFPTTRVFSYFARSTLDDLEWTADPDGALLAWLEREEVLFRTLERHIIGDRLQEGFEGDVDSFIKFSLSVQNRRKSRAGSSFENHLEHLFGFLGLQHSRTAVTEGKAKPDFLFPGQTEYLDVAFPDLLLTMLAAKSTCKDRWRQILAKAERVDLKHLVTLEPSIRIAQTDEMQSRSVQLVLPRGLHQTYAPAQQLWLSTLSDFTALALDRQQQAAALR